MSLEILFLVDAFYQIQSCWQATKWPQSGLELQVLGFSSVSKLYIASYHSQTNMGLIQLRVQWSVAKCAWQGNGKKAGNELACSLPLTGASLRACQWCISAAGADKEPVLSASASGEPGLKPALPAPLWHCPSWTKMESVSFWGKGWLVVPVTGPTGEWGRRFADSPGEALCGSLGKSGSSSFSEDFPQLAGSPLPAGAGNAATPEVHDPGQLEHGRGSYKSRIKRRVKGLEEGTKEWALRTGGGQWFACISVCLLQTLLGIRSRETRIDYVERHSDSSLKTQCHLKHSQPDPGPQDGPKDSEVCRGHVGALNRPCGP